MSIRITNAGTLGVAETYCREEQERWYDRQRRVLRPTQQERVGPSAFRLGTLPRVFRQRGRVARAPVEVSFGRKTIPHADLAATTAST